MTWLGKSVRQFETPFLLLLMGARPNVIFLLPITYFVAVDFWCQFYLDDFGDFPAVHVICIAYVFFAFLSFTDCGE